jgi:hypothetical protein
MKSTNVSIRGPVVQGGLRGPVVQGGLRTR